MILTHDVILDEIKNGRVVIDPFSEDAVGPASIDLRLASELRVFRRVTTEIVDLTTSADHKAVTDLVDIRDGWVLKPNEFVLGITRETISLPDDICGWLQSRSRFARFGFMSHITAPFISPGVTNRQVLEIMNVGPHPIKLIPGIRVCQLILDRCEGHARYDGIFRDQSL